jgi:hypothetical protein
VKVLNQREFPFLFYDLDGNGDPSGILVAPAGGGGLTKIPR